MLAKTPPPEIFGSLQAKSNESMKPFRVAEIQRNFRPSKSLQNDIEHDFHIVFDAHGAAGDFDGRDPKVCLPYGGGSGKVFSILLYHFKHNRMRLAV